MNRRDMLVFLCMCLTSSVEAGTKNKQFVAKIKTKSGSITGNIVVWAKNSTEATAKVMKQHKGCTVLSLDEK